MTYKRKEVIGDCTLYLGDCLEVLPTLVGQFDAICTDPPYGIGYSPACGGGNIHKKSGHKYKKTFTGKNIVVGDQADIFLPKPTAPMLRQGDMLGVVG